MYASIWYTSHAISNIFCLYPSSQKANAYLAWLNFDMPQKQAALKPSHQTGNLPSQRTRKEEV